MSRVTAWICLQNDCSCTQTILRDGARLGVFDVGASPTFVYVLAADDKRGSTACGQSVLKALDILTHLRHHGVEYNGHVGGDPVLGGVAFLLP
ncbi:hypothetical protein Nepgr_020894 [Nepenthes gracilis]|uniref:Uncharacterized protein n=1 Tax=Nepenthes gracilis TaxID=150966 RepID=A0AAD3SW09_NEPGR|nr:hypothetical protein Nepgr_020894 [Nepenthes gracilis]